MPADSDPIVETESPDGFSEVIIDAVSHVQFKLISMLFIVFILINSDTFISRVLGGFSGAVDHRYPTTWGVCIQGLMLASAMILIDILVRQKII